MNILKNKYLIFFLLLVVSCSIKPDININPDENRLYNDVKILTEVYPSRNYRNIDSLNYIAEYIENEFKKLDCNVSLQKFTVEETEYKNIIAAFGPEDADRIIIGAHYDVCENQPGADDNASAVAGLLELARIINKNKPELTKRIDFAAYTLEEPPFFDTELMGSMVHAKFLADNNINVKLMICLESIGYFSEEKKSQKYPLPLLKLFYPDKGNFIGIVSLIGTGKYVRKIKKSFKRNSDVKVKSLISPLVFPGIDLSDHQSYWKYGFKALMITDTAFFRNPNYHKITDTIDTLDFDKIAEIVRSVYYSIIEL